GVIMSYVVIALYQARPVVAGFNLVDTLRYTWLVQASIMVVLPFSWLDLMMTIRTGDVVTDLSKPFDFYWYWFSREIGRSSYFLLFRALPIYVAGMLIFRLGVPTAWSEWLFFCVTLLLAAMLGIAFRFLYSIAAFWLLEARAVSGLAVNIALFCGGSFIPLPFLPPQVRSAVEWLPFSGLLNLPTQVFLGKISGGALWFEIGRQMGWLMLLTAFALWLTSMATRRVVAQGG
ncbi:MAG: hypothetical protein J2P36_05895, partial [Ktedonobacteraceae bacterium]|nr:hypothetical protein [Ktedonobacteraceae bacterium]